MGLDTVELVLAIEEEFGISLDHADFDNLATVGDMQLEIQRQLDISITPVHPDGCPSIAPFLKLRQLITLQTEAARADVRPSAKLRDLIPLHQRESFWRRLQSDLQLRLPAMTPHQRLLAGGIPLSIAVALLLSSIHPALGGLLIPLSALCLAGAFLWHDFPAQCQTVGDVVRVHLRREQVLHTIRTSDGSLLARLIHIIAEQLDFPPEDITTDSRFIEDLLCD